MRRAGGKALPNQRGGVSDGVECKGRESRMDREHEEDLLDRVLNWERRRNVGKAKGPQTALGCAIAGHRPNRAAKRQGKRQAQPPPKGEGEGRASMRFLVALPNGAANPESGPPFWPDIRSRGEHRASPRAGERSGMKFLKGISTNEGERAAKVVPLFSVEPIRAPCPYGE